MIDHSEILIDLALAEDIGEGDVTVPLLRPRRPHGPRIRGGSQKRVVSGTDIAARVFAKVDPTLEMEILIPDGSRVSEGALLIRVEGKARSILTAERTALNFLQRLSGVATLTARFTLEP
jgi:nicotinate-nucleotide pyrophosphorylase (carboxylating)